MPTTHAPLDRKRSDAARILADARRMLTERRVEDALASFHHAEQHGCAKGACAAGRWECHMLLGDFEEAWRESDAIERRNGDDPNRLWDGSSFDGKHVMVRCLHGYGDAIQFIRYVPLLRKRAASIIVETHPEMLALLRRARGVQEVIAWGNDAPHPSAKWDTQVEVMELPRAFRTSLPAVPAQVPYVQVSRQERVAARKALGLDPGRTGRPQVGLIWRSSGWNPLRSMELGEMLPLCSVRDCDFHSLQWRATDAEARRLDRPGAPGNLAGSWSTINEFAVLLSAMDLIVTVDTMAAHLAGALAVPVWVMLPHSADWRWMLDREDSPWYPTMRLFRQDASHGWRNCVHRVETRLRELFRGEGKVPTQPERSDSRSLHFD